MHREAALIRPMLIVCPSCATCYDVQPARLPPQGGQVRCLRCHRLWYAELSRADKLRAAAAAIAPAAIAAEAAFSQTMSGPPPVWPADEQFGEALPLAPAAMEASGAPAPKRAENVGCGAAKATAIMEFPPMLPGRVEEEHAIDVVADRAAIQDAEAIEPEDGAARRHRHSAPRRRLPAWPLSRLQSAMLGLFLVDVILVGWRTDVVRAMPQTASFYGSMGMPVNLRGLTFANVVTTAEQHEGVPILVIDGNLVNGTRKAADVPRLKFILRSVERQQVYSWIAVSPRSSLPAGKRVAFHTSLASPPPEAHDLVVRFVTRRDLAMAAR